MPDLSCPGTRSLVPAYNRPEVVGDLIAAMAALGTHRTKLRCCCCWRPTTTSRSKPPGTAPTPDVITPSSWFRPPVRARKPKACNYGLHFATGDIITIYDAGDLPEPFAVAPRRRGLPRPADEICIQAKLVYHNSRQNLLTAWFTAEYGLWFGYLLPD